MTLNPLEFNKDVIQYLSWKHLKNKTKYELEFILPHKAPVIKSSKGPGTYWRLVAEVLKTVDLNTSSIFKGETVFVDVPIRTFNRAWVAVSKVVRDTFYTEEDNCMRIVFTKDAKGTIFIHEVEKMLPTPEQKSNALEQYAKDKQYEKDRLAVND